MLWKLEVIVAPAGITIATPAVREARRVALAGDVIAARISVAPIGVGRHVPAADEFVLTTVRVVGRYRSRQSAENERDGKSKTRTPHHDVAPLFLFERVLGVNDLIINSILSASLHIGHGVKRR
jgi:hypothetical protein